MSIVPVPLHRVHIKCDLCSGCVKVGMRSSLPVPGVDFILGNDLAGANVMPVLEVLDVPEVSCGSEELGECFPEVFSACAVTRAQARKFEDEIDLSDFFIVPVVTGERSLSPSGVPDTLKTSLNPISNEVKAVMFTPENSSIIVNRKQMSDAQQSDPLLHKCFNSAVRQEVVKEEKVAYFIDDGLLMRKWCSNDDAEGDWSSVFQIVVPVVYRTQVLRLAHDHQLAGHLGITKTYDRILRHFFWPGLKKKCV